jgi:hypothetical protein
VDFYNNVTENPDNKFGNFDASMDGELMLSVADKAFIKKFGNNTDLELPGEIAALHMNYDEGEIILGDSLDGVDLPKNFPNFGRNTEK